MSAGRWERVGGACAALGLVACVAGAVLDVRRAAAAYLVAYAAVTSVVLGALALVMIARLTAATWFVVLRRPAERVIGALPVLAVLVVPLLAVTRVLYPWTAPGVAEAKRAWLNVPFFVVRTAVYWACWVLFGEALRRASVRLDRAPDAGPLGTLRALSAGGVVVFALTVSFAAIDWLMSLTPAWHSTVYGVYFYAGGQVGALALLAVVAERERHGALRDAISPSHVAALAKLLLTFVLFWVYIGYSQLVVVWSADLPAEVAWYLPRLHGPARAVSALLLAGHFALPFLLLLPGAVRRSGRAVAALGVWLLAMHYLDTWWLVVPSVAPGAVPAWWLDAGALLLVGGATLAGAAWRGRALAALPTGDPRLEASLGYASGGAER